MKPIIILLIIFFVVRYIRKRYFAAPRQDAGGGGQARPQEKSGEEMVLDPVCNSYISLSSSVSVRTEDGVEHFCSEECREKFLERA